MTNDISATNLFVYCGNNPIIRTDPTGHSFIIATCAVILTSSFFACISPEGQARAQAVIEKPGLYNVGNWLTIGTFDMIKGTFAPEKPLSLQHWADSLGTATLMMPALSAVDDLTRLSPKPQTPVIGKMQDLNNYTLGKNEFKVSDLLPYQGTPKANWKQNSSVLRSLMNGNPIKDISPYPLPNSCYLGAERNLLALHGYVYQDGYWIMP